jgi:GT2 family glycosyltransferase
MLQRHFPAVRPIQSVENMGFAKANNQGFEQSRGENILFLNPDTEIVGPAIQTMLRSLNGRTDAGIVGAKLLNSDLSVQTSCIQRFPTILNRLLDSAWLRRKFPSSRLWGTWPLTSNAAAPVAVEVISGACLMIRRDVFVGAGGFDEGYFMYSEDVDLCFEVRKRGYNSYYIPMASVVHHGGRSSDTKSETHFAAVMTRESLLRFMRFRYGRFYGDAYRAAVAISAIPRLFAIPLLMIGARRSRRQALRVTFSKWLKLLCWALGSKEDAKHTVSGSAKARTQESELA